MRKMSGEKHNQNKLWVFGLFWGYKLEGFGVILVYRRDMSGSSLRLCRSVLSKWPMSEKSSAISVKDLGDNSEKQVHGNENEIMLFCTLAKQSKTSPRFTVEKCRFVQKIETDNCRLKLSVSVQWRCISELLG